VISNDHNKIVVVIIMNTVTIEVMTLTIIIVLIIQFYSINNFERICHKRNCPSYKYVEVLTHHVGSIGANNNNNNNNNN
jgi:hypothetical protein